MTPETLGTTSAPAEEKIKWVTPKEAEECERMLFKNYVRLDPKYKKPVAEAKDFFYKIIGMHPSSPANITTNDDQFHLVFEVQKYYRNKTKKVNSRQSTGIPGQYSETEVDMNEPVKRWEQNRKGNWILVDEDASFMMESRRFLLEFAPDNNL